MLPPWNKTMIPLKWKLRMSPGYFWDPYTMKPKSKKVLLYQGQLVLNIKGTLVVRKSMTSMQDIPQAPISKSHSVIKVNKPAIPLLGMYPKELKAGS